MAYQPMCRIVDGGSEEVTLAFSHEISYVPVRTGSDYLPYHTQPYYELIFFLDGRRWIRTPEEARCFGRGDVFLARPDQPHAGAACPEKLDRYYHHVGASLDREELGQLLPLIFGGDRMALRLPETAFSAICGLLSQTEETLRYGYAPVRRAEAYGQILRTLALLARVAAGGAEVSARPRILTDILAYLESDYDRISGLEQVCSLFYLSKSTLWRLFSEHLGQSPGQVLRRIRLHHAAGLLEAGCSVSETARRCGFPDDSGLIAAFRSRYGVTPGQWRRGRTP